MTAYITDFNKTSIAIQLLELGVKFKRDKKRLPEIAKQYRHELIRYQMCK